MAAVAFVVSIWTKKSKIKKIKIPPWSLHLKALFSAHHSPRELSIITLMDFKNSIKNASQESKMAFELLKESKQASLQVGLTNFPLSVLAFRLCQLL